MKKIVRMTLGLLAGVLLTAPWHCQAEDAPKKLKLAFVTNNASVFWTYARKGCEQAIKELNNTVELDFKIPATGSAAEQQSLLDDLLSKGEDGIAVSPKDPANQTDILNKIASQALLICHDSDAPKSNRVCYIGTSNELAGEQAGKLIREVLPQGGKIMLFVGNLDSQNAKERYEGIKKVLNGTSVTIIDVRTDESDHARAKSNVSDTLVKYPDVACLVGLYSYNGPAIIGAVTEANATGKVKIVCFDEEEETLDGIASGAIYGTVVQQPYEFGHQAILRMAKYLRGDKTVFPKDGVQIIPTQNIKKDNVEKFRAHLKELVK